MRTWRKAEADTGANKCNVPNWKGTTKSYNQVTRQASNTKTRHNPNPVRRRLGVWRDSTVRVPVVLPTPYSRRSPVASASQRISGIVELQCRRVPRKKLTVKKISGLARSRAKPILHKK